MLTFQPTLLHLRPSSGLRGTGLAIYPWPNRQTDRQTYIVTNKAFIAAKTTQTVQIVFGLLTYDIINNQSLPNSSHRQLTTI